MFYERGCSWKDNLGEITTFILFQILGTVLSKKLIGLQRLVVEEIGKYKEIFLKENRSLEIYRLLCISKIRRAVE
jgi:hypothetical protein